MTKTLKEWAKQFNGIPYSSLIDIYDHENIIAKLEKDGVVIAYGCSDDLLEFTGALYEEGDCYSDTTFYWTGKKFVSDRRYEEMMQSLEEDYPEFFEASAFKKVEEDFKNNPSIKVFHDKDGMQFVFEPSFECEFFNVVEDGEIIYKGFVFNINSLNKE